MTLTATASVYAASLAIYILLLPITLYLVKKHGWTGAPGWCFLAAFEMLQTVASGILVADNEHPSFIGLILSAVGLSPLLLGIAGLVHEVQMKILEDKSKKIAHVIYLVIHAMTVPGVVLLATGLSSLYSAKTSEEIQSSLGHWKTGAVLLLVAWVVIVGISIYSLLVVRRVKSQNLKHGNAVSRLATRYMLAILVANAFVGIKAIDTLVYAATQDSALNPASGTIAAKVCLQFLPQLAAVLSLIVGGFSSRNMNQVETKERSSQEELVGWR